ncbi:MAG: hypothetical protein CSYNP_02350 [Syntrophus sp. SKADARSKE-3]|nr:hypothetical protein [Syntrophus sp. SKADARSKE-3]
MRLSNTFMELMSYTAHLLQRIKQGESAPYDDVFRLYDVLYKRARILGQADSNADEDFQEAWFAVCAWVDEMLLCSEWPERDRWEGRQLQRLYFNTVNGGEEFFIRLQALPPEKGQVREVYLYCLAMGFKGQFFSPKDEAKLLQIRQDNLLLIRDPEEINDTQTLFSEAYSITPMPGKRIKWRFGLSWAHFIIIAVSLLFLGGLFSAYRYILDDLVSIYLG